MTIKDSSKIILYILSILCIVSIILSIINIFRKPKCPDFCKLPDSGNICITFPPYFLEFYLIVELKKK